MKRVLVFGLVILMFGSMAGYASEVRGFSQNDSSIAKFWETFRDAVIKGNKTVVGNLSKFPISMPYGIATVRNRTQLVRRYRDVFNHDGSSASECFATAKPVSDPARPNEFTVGCKNTAGDEVIIYTFLRTPTGWRFAHLDNINE